MKYEDSVKKVFDLAVAFVALLVLVPAFVVVSVLIKLDSAGPVLYRARRIGFHGKSFYMLKFRSMVVDAEQRGGTSTGLNDPRVTRVGRILRRYKIDEFPQLINVLKGEMSLVGPRPEVEEYTTLYSPEEMLILTVKPGITDLASVEFSNLDEHLGEDDVDTAYAERVMPLKNQLRLKYVREHTFVGDIRIIWKTLVRLLGV